MTTPSPPRRSLPGRMAMIVLAGVVGLWVVGTAALMLTHGSLQNMIFHDRPSSSSGTVPSPAPSEADRSKSYRQGYQSGAFGDTHDIRANMGSDDVACATTMGSPPPDNEDDWDQGCLAGLRDHPVH